MSSDVGTAAIDFLRQLGVTVEPGLSEAEFADLRRRFGFDFGEDHRSMLSRGLPLGRWWVDWRSATDLEVQQRLDEAVRGAMAHVEPGGLWPESWGRRPEDEPAAQARAYEEITRWPRLIPIYSHRYTEAAPSAGGAPVLSISGTDVIYYGADLLDYLANEFETQRELPPTGYLRPVPPWTELDP